MENKDMQDKGGCTCGMCGGHHFGHHHWGHWVLKIVVVVFIFWCGVQLGELKQELRSNYGPMMNWHGSNQGYYYSGPGMMGVYGTVQQATTTPRQ
jgi:hypothetical protein